MAQQHARHRTEDAADAGRAGASATDPVCGMVVDPHTAAHRGEHGGRTYYFCSARCAEKFAAAPESYLGERREQAADMPADAIYTCPMHPEIRRDGPGRRGAHWCRTAGAPAPW